MEAEEEDAENADEGGTKYRTLENLSFGGVSEIFEKPVLEKPFREKEPNEVNDIRLKQSLGGFPAPPDF